jgi:hypothetical protein
VSKILINSPKTITMAKLTQHYPKIEDEASDYYGYLDINELENHKRKLQEPELKEIIRNAIVYAQNKSSRKILNMPDGANEAEKQKLYKKAGEGLFRYFVKYCGDPASSAHDSLNKHYQQIAIEQFRNRTLQKERMNSGWRYQSIAKDTANRSGRFISVSDIGMAEADFNAIIAAPKKKIQINIYTSVKNRSNTLGGQDWPKAIHALEAIAKNDKNRTGPYICVFGIAMEKGLRSIKNDSKSGNPHSHNTEIWFSDFFWPFFSNFSYEEIIKAVLEVLLEQGTSSVSETEIPVEIINTFGEECKKYGLLDENGFFNDAFRLVELFCGKLKL